MYNIYIYRYSSEALLSQAFGSTAKLFFYFLLIHSARKDCSLHISIYIYIYIYSYMVCCYSATPANMCSVSRSREIVPRLIRLGSISS